MATQFLILFLLIFTTYVLTISGEENNGFVASLDPESLGIEKKETISHFRFYWHEIFSGDSPTSVKVVPSLPKYNMTTSFGAVGTYDNVLTLGPELKSKVVGKAQGLFASTSQTEFALTLVANFALTEGKYNGSSITFVGRSPISHKVREMPVIGGNGVFRFAKGYVESRTFSIDPQTNDNTIQFDVYVSH